MKALCLIDQNPLVKQAAADLATMYERRHERTKFLKKQLDDEVEKGVKEATEYWDNLEVQLIEQGTLPRNYDKKKQSLRLDEKAGVLFIYDNQEREESNVHPAFRSILAFFGGDR